MLAKQYRLTGKDINFLVKKRNIVYAGLFTFFYYSQYPNNRYNQISVNIPVKVDKRAVMRNMLKRKLTTDMMDGNLYLNSLNNKYYKIFISINKKNIKELKEIIASKEKRDTIKYISKKFDESKKIFANKCF